MAKKSAAKVIVRTKYAGVHYGTLAATRATEAGKEADLTGARRLWSWSGANTLHEISLRGVGKGSRVSEPVESITVSEVIEVIPCTAEASKNLDAGTWG